MKAAAFGSKRPEQGRGEGTGNGKHKTTVPGAELAYGFTPLRQCAADIIEMLSARCRLVNHRLRVVFCNRGIRQNERVVVPANVRHRNYTAFWPFTLDIPRQQI